MKRLRVDEHSEEGSGPSLANKLFRQALPNPGANAYSHTVKVIGEGMQSGLYPPTQQIGYGTMPAATVSHSGKPQSTTLSATGHNIIRTSGSSPPGPLQEAPQQQSPSNFQRLKVEDALSYLDLVKFKFSSKPQVYNDFLDIMKEFKSQSIDTPGVIHRVSTLFKGFPELIGGFNTFLPPGYKIEVQKSDQGGYNFSISVSVPSPTGTISSEQKSAMILSGSGRINMSGPPNQPVPQPQLSPFPLPQHITSVPPPVTAPPAPAVVHHSSSNYGMPTPSSTYGLSLSAAQAAVNHALQGHTDTPQNQPVEFNHAINYVNKIKNRFQGQPEKYKRFLEILHTYQKEQRTIKESNGGSNVKHLTEQEVYSQVAKLFENQSDLLAEFGQFLPDATNHINQAPISEHSNSINKKSLSKPYHRDHLPDRHISHKSSHQSGTVKRSPPYSSYHHKDGPPPKKHKMSSSYRDVSLTEAGKYGTLNDYAFFDKVRKALKYQEVYNNFLRCLTLFNQEIISKSELLQIVTPFLGKLPDLFKWFREFVSQNETEPIPFNVARAERPQGDHNPEIDLSTAKRIGASYCIIPKVDEASESKSKTALCREVLNNQWVSFPTWSEDSTFVSSRKTQYEEHMYRCEDERFELDVVIETNASTIRVLESVQKKISRMSQDDLAKFTLDDSLGGQSTTLHQRALKRIYGDKGLEIIEGLKKNPVIAVPIVLKRLKAKEDEWREAQKGFSKLWREQNEKYYLKSLDHQGINFKQTDVKAIRTKSLFNEIETIFDERHEQNDEGSEPVVGPHLVLVYSDKEILDDAANLLIHHVKRQTGIQKVEKKKIKHLLRQFLPDLFFHQRQPISDDEREDDDENDDRESAGNSPKEEQQQSKCKTSISVSSSSTDDNMEVKFEVDVKDEDTKVPLHAQSANPDEAYTLFLANNNWYIFLRLHAILCERLLKIYQKAVQMANEEKQNKATRKESTAIALRLKPKPQIALEDYYPAFLDMVKNLLDGNMEANTYEDTLREMFGIHAYIVFTLDKVISYAVRQLQHCVTERTALGCTDLYLKEARRGAAGGPCNTAYKRIYAELAYQRAAEKVVQEENCFKIYIYKHDCKMTIELLDTEPEDPKKVEETHKWSNYKERYASITHTDSTKPSSPVYLNRNIRLNRKENSKTQNDVEVVANNENQINDSREINASGPSSRLENSGNLNLFEALERKLKERIERNETEHPGYEVDDEQQCKLNFHDAKITFTMVKDSYLYKNGSFLKARQIHLKVTKNKGGKFRGWWKKWSVCNVSEVQSKQCTDWLMGRSEGVVPNRTRVLSDNDLERTPYVPYNRYRVESYMPTRKENSHPQSILYWHRGMYNHANISGKYT